MIEPQTAPRLTVNLNGHGLWGMERDAVLGALRDCNGNKTAAAALLKVNRGTFYEKLRRIEESPADGSPAVQLRENIAASETVLRTMCAVGRAATDPPLFVTRAEYALAKFYGLLTAVFICFQLPGSGAQAAGPQITLAAGFGQGWSVRLRVATDQPLSSRWDATPAQTMTKQGSQFPNRHVGLVTPNPMGNPISKRKIP